MKFQVVQTSRYKYLEYIELESLEALLKFIDSVGMTEVIIRTPDDDLTEGLWRLEIYDDYRE